MWRIGLLAIGLLPLVCMAEEGDSVVHSSSFDPTSGKRMDSPDRFRAYGDNYATYQWVKSVGWMDDWEHDLQGHFSLGYTFIRTKKVEFLFTYTGEFDFYVLDRSSGPVVNRLNNPAFHLAFLPALVNRNSRQPTIIDIGIEHESDGQVTEVNNWQDTLVAQENYVAGNRPFFDQISRGSNFVSVSARMTQDNERNRPFSVQAAARIYVTQDYDVTWGPQAGKNKRLSNFNLLRARIGHEGKLGNFELQWTVGSSGFKDHSFEAFWQAKTGEDTAKLGFPWFVKLHYGPLNTLSNYTQKQYALGFGWRFSSFPRQDRKLLRPMEN